MTKEVPDGLFFAAVTKFAADCGNNSHCAFGKILMGKDSWLKFHGGVNKAGVNVKAGVYGIPIKGDLKFNKVELFVEVRNVKTCALSTRKTFNTFRNQLALVLVALCFTATPC